VQFNAFSCLCEHSLGDIIRYKNIFSIGINLWRLFQLVSKLWRSYFNWYWWIIFKFGISRNMSSVGILMTTRASNGRSTKIKHNFVIFSMIKKDRHKWSLFYCAKPIHELLYYLCASRPLHASVCMCMQYLSHTMSLFLW
jgi:hypothetical protein